MKSDSGSTQSVWTHVPELPSRPPLDEDLQTEICVVGAGMAGLSVAYMLARDGRAVIVIDDGPIAGGETSRTTAHLTNVVDDRYHWIEHVHGEEGARIVAESHTAAIQRIGSIAEEERIECDFERLDAYLFLPPGDPPDELERELEAAQRAGVLGVTWTKRAPFRGLDTGRCLRFPGQAQFHPLRYLAGLVHAIEGRNGRVYRQTHASSIEEGPPPSVVTKAGPVIHADRIIVATNSPVHTRLKIHPKQAAYRTYVIAVRIPRGSVTRALYYDTPWPYHYVRLHSPQGMSGDMQLLVGGEDHKTGQADDAEDRWAALESWTRERFPTAGKVMNRWSGQVFEPMDGVAFIGRDTDHVYVATGDSGMGMTHGTIAGMLLTDLIQGRENSWAKLYDPGRISLRAAGEFVKETLNFASRYAQYLTGGDVDSLEGIAPGTGAVVGRGAKKVAAYRDERGKAHVLSAVCPHLGCIVAWNSAEKTWDCPCHGSRFDPHGRVLTGPANRDLEPTDEEFPPLERKATTRARREAGSGTRRSKRVSRIPH